MNRKIISTLSREEMLFYDRLHILVIKTLNKEPLGDSYRLCLKSFSILMGQGHFNAC